MCAALPEMQVGGGRAFPDRLEASSTDSLIPSNIEAHTVFFLFFDKFRVWVDLTAQASPSESQGGAKRRTKGVVFFECF